MVRAPLTIVDVANVLGSRPDGWWRDRAAATRRLLDSMAQLPLPGEKMVAVLEGRARAAAPEGDVSGGLRVVHAPGSGDEQIIDIIRTALSDGSSPSATVITADRQLRDRAEALGAASQAPHSLRGRIAALTTTSDDVND
jgi:hypothetical protein